MIKYTILLTGIIALVACNTAPPIPVMSEPIIHEVSDVKMEFRYLSEDVLKSRHGSNGVSGYINPYYNYPTLITKKRLIVFELTGTSTESTVMFKLKDIDLQIGRITGNAKSRPYLEKIWGAVDNVKLSSITKTIKKTLLPQEFTIEPDNPVKGYLVFGENYPQEGGDGMITFYVSTPGGDEGTMEIPLKFSSDGNLGTSTNDGPSIFSDTEN